jgi:hypothetical protein
MDHDTIMTLQKLLKVPEIIQTLEGILQHSQKNREEIVFRQQKYSSTLSKTATKELNDRLWYENGAIGALQYTIFLLRAE